MSDGECVRCGLMRRGRHHVIHLGLELSAETRMTGFTSWETTRKYQMLGSSSGFVCRRCAVRHLFLGFTLPLLTGVAIELLLMFGSPLPWIDLAPWVLKTLAVVMALLVTAVAGASMDASTYMRSTSDEFAVFLVAVRLPFFWAGALGSWFFLVVAFVNNPDERGVIEGSWGDTASALWAVGVIVGSQTIMLLTVWGCSPVLLQTLTWEHRREALRTEFDEPKLIGFNIVQYRRIMNQGP
ncbi:hypothetical protein LO763_11460 [Glycomyces sp. A-F 0318]|uniref:hypothetical protein n=1 Tax=Glycomyces amatae TaxID=2881355 RepID=UPI001E2E4E48|nr:hypothetical protein [Glycomyces amatae]MCD0444239.1 hypothetical protein [Glycomyces amatae]